MSDNSKIVGLDGKHIPAAEIDKIKRQPSNWCFVMKKDNSVLYVTGYLVVTPMFIGVADDEGNLMVSVPYGEFEAMGLANILDPNGSDDPKGGLPVAVTNPDGTKTYDFNIPAQILQVDNGQKAA